MLGVYENWLANNSNRENSFLELGILLTYGVY